MINFQLSYQWVPFTVNGSHYYYSPELIRLSKGSYSHQGSVVYKWEGALPDNKTGVLIGEAQDLHARIRQYRKGTQENGNKYWRDTFLSQGRIHLHVIEIQAGKLNDKDFIPDLSLKHWRLVVEQFLIAQVRAEKRPDVILINKT